MKPKYQTTLFHNKYVIGYHTNNCAHVRSFATNHFVYMDSELKDVQWIAEQYSDEIVVLLKVQLTDTNAYTHTKSTICHFKTPCNLNTHINTVL